MEDGYRRGPWWLYVLAAICIHWWIPSDIGISVNSFVLDFSSSSYRSALIMRKHRGAQKNPWTENDASLIHRRYDQKHVPESTDYILIGSGIGGLWLAACLSKFGKTCLVLEQHFTAGGFQHSFRRGPYEFVPGLHYIANLPLCAPLYEMVATPTDPPLKFHQAGNSVPADNNLTCSHDLQVGSLPTMQVREGLESVRAELTRVFPEETTAIDDFLRIMEQVKWQAGQFATFKIFPPWQQWLLSQFICSNYIRYASQTTHQVLQPITSGGRLKTVLSAFGGDFGESLADGSFVMQAAVLGHVLEGCYYPQSGPMHFVRGLVPTIRKAGGDLLVQARVEEILIDYNDGNGRATGVKLANGDEIHAHHGVVSDAGIRSTLRNLLPAKVSLDGGPLSKLRKAVEECSEGISHVFLFVGLNASTEDLMLRSSSFYYIPWNETDPSMDATGIQDFCRDTLLDPTVMDVSAGMVFCTAKDPEYSAVTMPGKNTVIVFSEARASDFVALPLTIQDYTLCFESLGLRHTPQRMTDMSIRPDCAIKDLYFTRQDIAFAGWAGALAGAMVTAHLT